MRLFALLTAFPLGTALLAQTPAPLPTRISPSNIVILPASATEGCPVGFAAQHANQGALISVRPGTTPPRQSYNLSFTPRGNHPITQARVTLHGLSGGQFLPAGETASQTASQAASQTRGDATEDFTLAPRATSNDRFYSTVFVHKLTGVQWIELNEVTYADGTRWRESSTALCHITPNGMLRVNE